MDDSGEDIYMRKTLAHLLRSSTGLSSAPKRSGSRIMPQSRRPQVGRFDSDEASRRALFSGRLPYKG